MTPGVSGDASGSAPESSFSAATTHSASGSKDSSDGGGGATTSSSSAAMKKGPWTAAEDAILMEYVRKHGEGNWNAVQKNSGLSRCGKSCRLRWANHLRPNLKKGPFSPDEERLILELHSKMGNKWARMAAQLPGRTDNEIKNYWNTRIKRRQRAGLPLYPPDIQHQAALHHRPSAAPPPLSDHKALYSTSIGATPLSLFDTINFPGTAAPPQAAATTPLLGLGHHHPPPFFVAASAGAAGHQQRAKRFREDDLGSFSLPFTTSSLSPPPSQTPLFNQFHSVGGYVDLNPPPSPQQQSFSVKMELPSSQLFPEPSTAVPGGGSLPLGRSNAELLDALMRDTHAVGGGEGKSGNGLAADNDGGHPGRDGFPTEANPDEAKWVKWNGGGGPGGELPEELILGTARGKWDDWNHHHPSNAMSRRGAAEDAGSVDDDLSALLDLIPMAAAAVAAEPPEWHNSNNSGEVEVSNGQSSGVTDDNVGMDMQQLASSLSMAAEDHSWSIGSCHWHGMPGA